MEGSCTTYQETKGIYVLAEIIKAIMGSAAEAEVGGLYNMNAIELSPMKTTPEYTICIVITSAYKNGYTCYFFPILLFNFLIYYVYLFRILCQLR